MNESAVTFDAEGIRLEGRLSLPAGARAGAVVCHPHPRYGGTMDNNVVEGLVGGLAGAGVATLRFNFRGVGASQGRPSDSLAETGDARAAVAFLRGEGGFEHVILAGYSFGAIVASTVGPEDAGVDRLVLVGLPVPMFDPAPLRTCDKPKLFVHGDRDDFCRSGVLQDLVSGLRGANELRVVSGADHFFGGFESEIGTEVARFATREGER